MSKKRVLLTGVEGCIGSACRQHWGDHFAVRYLVYTDDQMPDDSDDVVVGGCQDFDLMVQATAGMDAVVHLAAIGMGHRASLEPLLDSNMIGTYNVSPAAGNPMVSWQHRTCRRGPIRSMALPNRLRDSGPFLRRPARAGVRSCAHRQRLCR